MSEQTTEPVNPTDDGGVPPDETGTELDNSTPEQEVLAPQFTREEAAAKTSEAKALGAALWTKMKELYDGGAHTALDYESWDKYAEVEFGMGKAYSYRLLQAAEVAAVIDSPNLTEAAARELGRIKDDPEAQREAYNKAVESAAREGTPTAAEVKAAVEATKPKGKGGGSGKRTDRSKAGELIADIRRAATAASAAQREIKVAAKTATKYMEFLSDEEFTDLRTKAKNYLTEVSASGGFAAEKAQELFDTIPDTVKKPKDPPKKAAAKKAPAKAPKKPAAVPRQAAGSPAA